MTVRKEDYKWLRCASLEHSGFLPGMSWVSSPYAHERLLAHGYIERVTINSLVREMPYVRAVITDKGRDALAARGKETIEYLAKLEADKAGISSDALIGEPEQMAAE